MTIHNRIFNLTLLLSKETKHIRPCQLLNNKNKNLNSERTWVFKINRVTK